MLWLAPSFLSPVGWIQAAIVADLSADAVAEPEPAVVVVAQQVDRKWLLEVVARRLSSNLHEQTMERKSFG